MTILNIILVTVYCLSLLALFLFSLGQLHLTHIYLKRRKLRENKPALKSYPPVTVQLPVYNEQYVVKRLIRAAVSLDYQGPLEIQVLDDSTDETRMLTARLVSKCRNKGIDIRHITRNHRTGYKAGALQHGLKLANGELIAIFDADFIPKPDFLKQCIPYFSNPDMGMVQTRWGHLNEDYNVLTKIQAFGLNAHFTIEQTGRNVAGSFINFNGTAGVWRKTCIEDAGGWSAETLTEDLDLSYRAQMRGWQFKYLQQVVSPAELPVLMSAVKTQQFRWNKGAAETARKHVKNLLQGNFSISRKIHGLLHLLNSSVFVFLLVAGILSIPMLLIKHHHPAINLLIDLGSIFLIGFFSIAYFYWISAKFNNPEKPFTYYISYFPKFFIVIMGLSLHNGLAVMEGLLGIKTSFLRTPKFNVFKKGDHWSGNRYIKHKISFTMIFEALLGIYFIGGLLIGISLSDYGLTLFHAMLAAGFLSVFYYSLRPWFYETGT